MKKPSQAPCPAPDLAIGSIPHSPSLLRRGVAPLSGEGKLEADGEGRGGGSCRSEKLHKRKKMCTEWPWSLASEFLHRVWERRVQNLSHVGIDLRCLDHKAAQRRDRPGPDARGHRSDRPLLSAAPPLSHLAGGESAACVGDACHWTPPKWSGAKFG